MEEKHTIEVGAVYRSENNVTVFKQVVLLNIFFALFLLYRC